MLFKLGNRAAMPNTPCENAILEDFQSLAKLQLSQAEADG
jgi:hypothetical protein